jgi:hypothetical protein
VSESSPSPSSSSSSSSSRKRLLLIECHFKLRSLPLPATSIAQDSKTARPQDRKTESLFPYVCYILGSCHNLQPNLPSQPEFLSLKPDFNTGRDSRDNDRHDEVTFRFISAIGRCRVPRPLHGFISSPQRPTWLCDLALILTTLYKTPLFSFFEYKQTLVRRVRTGRSRSSHGFPTISFSISG